MVKSGKKNQKVANMRELAKLSGDVMVQTKRLLEDGPEMGQVQQMLSKINHLGFVTTNGQMGLFDDDGQNNTIQRGFLSPASSADIQQP